MRSYSMLDKNKLPSILSNDENTQSTLKAYMFYIKAMTDKPVGAVPITNLSSSTFTRV